jgi:hypothetical protein
MLALYRSDRQADALAVYRHLRNLFAEELGLEPAAALRELEAAILRQDPAVGTPLAPPASALAPVRKPVTVLCVELRVAAARQALALYERKEDRVSVARARPLLAAGTPMTRPLPVNGGA